MALLKALRRQMVHDNGKPTVLPCQRSESGGSRHHSVEYRLSGTSREATGRTRSHDTTGIFAAFLAAWLGAYQSDGRLHLAAKLESSTGSATTFAHAWRAEIMTKD